MKQAIMDSGPLVAWFSIRDTHHQWAARTCNHIAIGALVCEAVLAEVCHLVAKDDVPPGRVMQLIEQKDLVLAPLTSEIAALRTLLERYADAPMDFADACVVRLAELHPDAAVCTCAGHFRFFRKNRRQTIPLIAPFGS